MFDIPIPDFKPVSPSEMLEKAKGSPNAFSSWFGVVQSCGARTPETIVIDVSPQLQYEMLEGLPFSDDASASLTALVGHIQEMGARCGFPLFIKTSFTAAKHYWKNSCCLPDGNPSTVLKHMGELIDFQAFCVGEVVTPSLVVREMIVTDPAFHAFDGMPVTEEYRVFTKGGKTEGFQPYWPEDSIQNASCNDWAEKLKTIKAPSEADVQYMSDVATRVASKLKDHDWSIDFLRGKDGNLWLIDMAVAGQSYRNDAEFVLVGSKHSNNYCEGLSL